MKLFYDKNITDASGLFSLNEDESKHILKVLRLNKNDCIKITDGKGNLFICKIYQLQKKRCIVKISEKKHIKNTNNNLHIAIAPTKKIDRFEWFVEKAVEIGISEITPIICRYSERKKVKTERLEKIIIAAMKQSLKVYKPNINLPQKFENFIKKNNNKNKYIAYCKATKLINSINSNKNILFLVGPEGGFADFEIDLASKNNFIPLKITNSRLRTETAALFLTVFNNLST